MSKNPHAIDPSRYLASTIAMFGPPTFVLMVTPRADGDHQANALASSQNHADSLDVLAAAEVMLQRQIGVAILAAAEATGKTVEEATAYFKAALDKQLEQTEDDHEASAVSERKPPAPSLVLPMKRKLLKPGDN